MIFVKVVWKIVERRKFDATEKRQAESSSRPENKTFWNKINALQLHVWELADQVCGLYINRP
jgi:hypothetical protein